MNVTTEKTPNPSAVKFFPGRDVMGPDQEAVHITESEAATLSPLAKNLFSSGNVQFVLFGSNFITVTTADPEKWEELEPQMKAKIESHFAANHPIFNPGMEFKKAATEIVANDDDMYDVSTQVVDLLDSKIRPLVEKDGGKILFESYDLQERTLYLDLQGSCAGCPSALKTLQENILNILRSYIGQDDDGAELIKEIRQVGAEAQLLTKEARIANFAKRWNLQLKA